MLTDEEQKLIQSFSREIHTAKNNLANLDHTNFSEFPRFRDFMIDKVTEQQREIDRLSRELQSARQDIKNLCESRDAHWKLLLTFRDNLNWASDLVVEHTTIIAALKPWCRRLHNRIESLFTAVWPLVDEVFPGVSEDVAAVGNIIGPADFNVILEKRDAVPVSAKPEQKDSPPEFPEAP